MHLLFLPFLLGMNVAMTKKCLKGSVGEYQLGGGGGGGGISLPNDHYCLWLWKGGCKPMHTLHSSSALHQNGNCTWTEENFNVLL